MEAAIGGSRMDLGMKVVLMWRMVCKPCIDIWYFLHHMKRFCIFRHGLDMQL
jgi:hypothetical protein